MAFDLRFHPLLNVIISATGKIPLERVTANNQGSQGFNHLSNLFVVFSHFLVLNVLHVPWCYPEATYLGLKGLLPKLQQQLISPPPPT